MAVFLNGAGGRELQDSWHYEDIDTTEFESGEAVCPTCHPLLPLTFSF